MHTKLDEASSHNKYIITFGADAPLKKTLSAIAQNISDIKFFNKKKPIKAFLSGGNVPSLFIYRIKKLLGDRDKIIRNVKFLSSFGNIPILFIVANTSSDALEFLVKFKPADVLKSPLNVVQANIRLRTLIELSDYRSKLENLVMQRTEYILQIQNSLISSMANLIEYRDDNTGGHIRRTQEYVQLLLHGLIDNGCYLDVLTDGYTADLVKSAPLHDIGKIKIPDKILNKKTKLGPRHTKIMNMHTTYGKQAIEEAAVGLDDPSFLVMAGIVAESHHERWDGNGYPQSLQAEKIPLAARIMSVADVYDACRSDRVYRPGMPHKEVVDIIIKGSGTQFDPKIVKIFIKTESEFSAISCKKTN